MKPNLDKLENLSDDQLKKISNDVDTVGIRKAAAQASKDTDRSIDKTTIQRVKERSIVNRFLAESPDAAQAAAEILRFAVTGRPDFSEATIKVLEETAFKLSLQCMHSEAETDPNSDLDSKTPGPEMPPKDSSKSGLSISELALKALNQITVMLARYRNTSVRERMAKLQEKKFELRCLEFEWKKSVHASKAEKNSAVRAPAASGPNSAVKENDLDRLAKTLDDVERRTCETFNLPYDGPTKPEPSSLSPTLSQTSSEPLSNTNAAAHLDSRSEQLVSGNKLEAGLGTHSSEIHAPTASSPQSAIPDPYLQTEKNSQADTSPLPPLPPVQNSELQAPTASSPQSAIESVPPRVKFHAIRRWRHHIPWPKDQPEPDGSWRDECPCGNPAPCSEHPELRARVRYYKPQHPEYEVGLKQSNVPYYKPTAEEIGCTQAALDRSCDLFADNPRMKDPPDPRFHPKWLKRPDY